jgi:methyl-accepting chemotaxis protein
MVEMVTVVSQVSENSHRAAESAQQAVAAAQSGGKIVNETLEEIHLISTSVEEASKRVRDLGEGSKQIGEISGVIDDIADQTNLLALNAAIEAARAGEQGRGFAVVADEVRKLAERTAHATAEIAQKIKRIQEETISTIEAMDVGTDLVKEGVKKTILAGDALKEIVRLAGIVGEMVNQIAAATTEQSSAVAEVNTTIDRITGISNETAAASEDAARSCDSLSQLATGLRKLVGQFTLSDSSDSSDDRSSVTRRKPPTRKSGPKKSAEQESVFELSER